MIDLFFALGMVVGAWILVRFFVRRIRDARDDGVFVERGEMRKWQEARPADDADEVERDLYEACKDVK